MERETILIIRKLRALLALCALVVATAATGATEASAPRRPDYDAVAAGARSSAPVTPNARASQLLRPGSELQMHERFGVPTFLWASTQGSAAGLTALRARLASGAISSSTPEAAARAHLGTYSSFYRLTDTDVSNLAVAHVHDIGRGPVIVQFKQVIGGVEVFREEVRVVMNRDLGLVSISGYVPSAEGTAMAAQRQLSSASAVAAAFSDLSGHGLGAGAFGSQGALEGGYESVALAVQGIDGAPTQPARVKPVWFHSTDGLQSAWYVEVDSANGKDTDYFSYVISAVDGSILYRHDLTAYDVSPHAYTYRVYAAPLNDPKNPGHPYDGPMGTLFDPHPSGTNDGTQFSGAVPQVDMTIASSVYSSDPWLPTNATVTTGNNVDAFVDLSSPDLFTPNSLDLRADLIPPVPPGSTPSFARDYDPLTPNAVNQQKAAVLQMFYNVNFFHDWYYVSGFNEAAGNAQANNYGRGGLQGDYIRAEGQDFASRNNANMSTPADGGNPRMRMYLFDGIADRHLYMTGTGLAADYVTGVPSGWGIASHDVTGTVVRVTDGVGSNVYPPATTTTKTIFDGCDYNPVGGVDPNWANVSGNIAFIDRGGNFTAPATACGFADKAVNAQKAGAIGVLIASTTTHGAVAAANMAGTPSIPITIPVYQVGQADGDAMRAALAAGPVTAELKRAPAIDRDGTLDTQIMAHEWGHYISNRLIWNSAGLNTNMAGGMGEGYADFHAMLLTVKEEDTSVPTNTTFNGPYGMAVWTSAGGSNGPTPNQGVYFGIRRMPYSTDFTKNNQTFKNIQDNSAIPSGAPFAFWPASGTTAASGGNSEVHNTGEVWASMLWECYAGILQGTLGPTPRLSFGEARDRMKDYIVAGYKATPGQPTFLEGRDALLSAIYASGNLDDYQACLGGFAKRGAGVGAVSPDRYSGTNNGVIESFSTGNQLNLAGVSFADDVTSCDKDNVLDSGETGTLTIFLRNDTPLTLTGTTAVVTAVGPNAGNITFPNGTTVNFPVSTPTDIVSGTVRIALAAGLTGIQQIDLQITPADPQLATQLPISLSRRGNYDDVATQSQTDDVESGSPVFTTVTLAGIANFTPWFRNENSAYDHSYKVADQNGLTDLALQSPNLTVGTGNFSVSFQHRYSFEFSGTTYFDGGVVEITTDGGNTWTDIGSLATGQAYTGPMAGGTPLGTRRAFGGISPGYPSYVTTTINLGTTYAGTTARIRFRAVSDSNSRADGWEVDNIAFTGIVNRPFPALLPNKCNVNTSQTNRRPTVTIAAQGAVAERTGVSLTATGVDLDGDPLTYSWAQVSGPAVTLVPGATPNIITFTAPDVPAAGGTVVIGVLAFDGTAYSTLATRSVTVTNVDRPPVVSAGSNQVVDERTLVQLAGSGSDPDGDAVSFAWTQTAGPTVTLSDPSVVNPTFVAPEVGVVGAVLTFKLTATANAVATNSSVNITVNNVNRAPVVSAGTTQTVDERTLVQLNGSATDADGDPLTFAWIQVSPAQPLAVLSSTTVATPTFTAPEVAADTPFVFQLSVSDGIVVNPVTATVTINVHNVPPPTFSVTYNGNGNTGGTAPVDGNAYTTGATVTVLGNTGPLVKTGNTFAGWNTAANGSSAGYGPGTTFAMGTANVTLYAQWTVNNYTVSFESNGGTAVASQSVPYNSTATSPPDPTKAGNNNFAGWYSDPGLGTPFNFGAPIVADTVLYAKWTPKPILDVDGNGTYDALTDGVLILRYLFGLTDNPLTDGAVGNTPARSTPADIKQYLDSVKPLLDVDGDGQTDALTDGLIIVRYLLGLRGPSLVAGAVGPGATRAELQIEAYIQSLMP